MLGAGASRRQELFPGSCRTPALGGQSNRESDREKHGAVITGEVGASLVVQWLRLRAPNSGARVQSLVRELDPTCHGED